jgi:K+-transporting ATPase ATPase A chain
MNFFAWLQYTTFFIIVLVLVVPVGRYLQHVFQGDPTLFDPLLRPVERFIYRLSGVDPQQEMTWRQYAGAFVLFSLVGTLGLYVILRVQPLFHTFDPAFQPTPLSPDLAFNTALSFSTTTTWQAYGGETNLSYFSQIVGLAAQNFLAGAAGLAVGIAFIRGFARERASGLGNFWVDLVRAVLWVLLPITVVGTLILVWQGVPLNFKPYQTVPLLQAALDANHNPVTTQVLPMGPVAALEFIKNLGTNGGGFFNVNGAHPFANPTPFTNVLGLWAIVVLPAGLTHTFGRLVGRPRQGWVLFAVMAALFIAGLAIADWAEQQGNPQIAARGVDISRSNTQAGGNMEGKETRFGISGSVLEAVTTSNTATGSVNSMHDSYSPIGGTVTIVNMLLGEMIFGGLGTGIYSIILVALIALFVAGLMVGRTPEYLGKRITLLEMKYIALYTIIGPLAVLSLTALAAATSAGQAGLVTNTGPHGFSEILVAYATSMANNGQNFAGLNANTPFYNITTAVAMMAGRFGLAIPALAVAGLFGQQGRRAVTAGTMPTDTVLFAILIIGTALIVGALSYFPALALGPLVEQLRLWPPP